MTSRPTKATPTASSGPSFEHVVHTLLVTEKGGSVADVARAIGLTPGAMYGRLHGRSRFKADEIRRLVQVVDDQRLLQFFADESRFVVARRPRPDQTRSEVLPATLATMHEAVDLFNIVMMALRESPRFDHIDKARMLKEVKDAETAIANLRATVEAMVV